jgi:hypothetical protein
MSLTQNGYSYPCQHGKLIQLPPDFPIVVGRYPGVKGEQHLIDVAKGVDYQMEAIFKGYATFYNLSLDVSALGYKVGDLIGDLTIIMADESTTVVPNATFIGFTPTEEPFYDGSGVNDWVQVGVLRWRGRGAS